MDERLRIQIEAETAALGAGLNRASTQIDGWARRIESGPLGRLQGVVGGLGGAIGGIAGVGLLTREIRQGVEGALEAEQILNRLTHAVELTGASFTREAPRIEEAIQRIFDTTRFDDEDARAALARLIAMTGDYEQSLRALDVAADMAAVSGGNLVTAAQQLGMVAAGASRAFKAFGIDLTETEEKAFAATDEYHRMEFALYKLQKLHGTAGSEMKGEFGEWTAMTKRWEDSWEDLGNTIVGALGKVGRFFDGIKKGVQENRTFFQRLFGGGFSPLAAHVEGTPPVDTPAGGGPPDMPPDPGNPRDVKKWMSDIAKFQEDLHELSRNISIVTLQVGSETEAVIAYADKILSAGEEADRFGVRLTARMAQRVELARQLSQAAGAVFDAHRGLGTEFDTRHGETEDEIRRRLFDGPDRKIALKVVLVPEIAPNRMKEIAGELDASLSGVFGTALTDIFADLAATGGQNFGEIAAAALQAGIRSAAEAFGNWVVEILGGGELQTNAAGQYVVGNQTFPGTPAGEQLARTAQGRSRYANIAQGISGAFGLYNTVSNPNAQNDFGTVLQGTLGGAALGGAVGGLIAGALAGSVVPVIGTIIGAVVGLIVGAISALSSSVGDEYQYATVGIGNGNAVFMGNQNITANEAREARSRLQSTFDEYRNGYIQILLDFPEQFQSGLAEVLRNSWNIYPQIGLESGGDLGRAASAHFMEHFNEWVNGRLPRQIAEMFFEPLATAFQGVGLSEGRFREIWDDLQDLDPRKAMELLGILATGLIDIFETMESFRTPSGFGQRVGGSWDPNDPTTLRGQVAGRDARTFAQTLAETDEEIFELAESLEFLTGEDQIRTVGEIGRLMRERYAQEEEYIRAITNMIDESTREIDAAIRGYQLDSIDDPQAQVEFLTRYLEDLYVQLGAATDPAEAQRIYREIFGTIQQITSIGGAQSPEDRDRFNAWAIGELTTLGNTYRAILADFGAEIDTINATFLARMGPMLDGFTGVATAAADVTASLGSTAAAGEMAAVALYEAAAAAREFAAAAAELDSFGARVQKDRAA